MDEKTLEKLDNIGEYLSMNNTAVLEVLVALGYDLLIDARCSDDTEPTIDRFLDFLYDRMNKSNRW